MGFDIEKKINVFLFLRRITFVLGINIFFQRIWRFNHRRDDIIGAELLALQQITDRFASAYFDTHFHTRATSYVQQAKQFVGSGTFGFKLGLHRKYPVVIASLDHKVQHLFFLWRHI